MFRLSDILTRKLQFPTVPRTRARIAVEVLVESLLFLFLDVMVRVNMTLGIMWLKCVIVSVKTTMPHMTSVSISKMGAIIVTLIAVRVCLLCRCTWTSTMIYCLEC